MLKIALVGCGRIAHRHAEIVGGGLIAGARLAAVCDIDAEKARLLAAKHGVAVHTDMHAMMQTEAIDAIAVLTESGNHSRHVVELARYGKHIIVEKPMALTLKDADAMIAACEQNSINLFVVKQNRFNVPVTQLRRALDQNRFGKLVLGTVRVRWCRDEAYYRQAPWRGTWAMDGGVLTNQASHHIDMLQWMFGEVETVFAKSSTALAEIEAEDTAVACLKFKNGALGIIEATTAVRPKDLEGSISVLGEKGSVEIAGFAVNKIRTWSFSKPEPGDDEVITKYSVNPPNVYGYGHQAYYDNIVNSILTGAKPTVDGHEGRKSVEILNAIYESVETGNEVSLPAATPNCKLRGTF